MDLSAAKSALEMAGFRAKTTLGQPSTIVAFDGYDHSRYLAAMRDDQELTVALHHFAADQSASQAGATLESMPGINGEVRDSFVAGQTVVVVDGKPSASELIAKACEALKRAS